MTKISHDQKARDYSSFDRAAHCTHLKSHKFVHKLVIPVTKYLKAGDYYNFNVVYHFAFSNIDVSSRVGMVDLKIFNGLCDAEK